MSYEIHSVGRIIATSPKVASTAIGNFYKTVNIKSLTAAAVVELKKSNWKVTGIVRDPIDRFESAYNFFQYGQCGNFPVGRFENINSFTDAVLAGVSDEHWDAQSGLLTVCDNYADLETLELPLVENAVVHREAADYRCDELMEFYKQDYKLRGSAWR
jgi:hypothetical protein